MVEGYHWAVTDGTVKDLMADQWEVVEFPAILYRGNHSGLSFGKDELLSKSVTVCWQVERTVAAEPTSEETAMVKGSGGESGKKMRFLTLTTLYSRMIRRTQKETADYSTITTWVYLDPTEMAKSISSCST